MRKYITVFFWLFSVALFGRQEINLSKIPFGGNGTTIGEILLDACKKYPPQASTKNECSEAYNSAIPSFQILETRCSKNINGKEFNEVLKSIEKIVKIQNDYPSCFIENFTAFNTILKDKYKENLEGNLAESEEKVKELEDSRDNRGGLFSWFWFLVIIIILGIGFWAYRGYEKEVAANTPVVKLDKNIDIQSPKNKSNLNKKEPIVVRENKQTIHEREVEKEGEKEKLTEREKLEKANREEQAEKEQSNKIEKEKLAQKEQKEKAEREKIAAKELQEREEKERIAQVQLAESQRLEAERLEKERKAQEKVEIFISIPSGEMEFPNNPRPRYTNGQTFYRFLVSNGNKAEFDFCTEATAFAIDKPQTHIIPVCTPQNARENNATGIGTIKKGIAHLDSDNDKWIVEQKAIIEYFY